MAKDLGELYVGVNCTNCGVHGEGRPTDNGRTRCGKCGSFAQEADNYCQKHDIHYDNIYPEDVHCPYCREERQQRNQEIHMATRDRRVEPW
jgi:hypothetical protein